MALFQRIISLTARWYEGFPIPGECIGGIGCRLRILLLLEGWILGTSLKKVLEAFVQVAQGLLNNHTRDITKPGVCFFQIRQHGREGVIVELRAMCIGSLAGTESPVI